MVVVQLVNVVEDAELVLTFFWEGLSLLRSFFGCGEVGDVLHAEQLGFFLTCKYRPQMKRELQL